MRLYCTLSLRELRNNFRGLLLVEEAVRKNFFSVVFDFRVKSESLLDGS